MSKTNPIFPPGYLDALADFCCGLDSRDTSPGAQVGYILGTAAFTTAVATHLVAYGAASLVRRIYNHFNPPPPPVHPKLSPSLRGTPSPGELSAAWKPTPRRLFDCLRIGSRLADLEPTLDSSFIFKSNSAGSKRIVARAPGLKGWLADNTPCIAYSTAMHYKKLASRLRQLIGLDARIPLEWLLPDSPDGQTELSKLPPADQQSAAAASRKLRALLAGNQRLTHLTLAVEQKLGIMRMVTIRRIQPRMPPRAHARKKHGKKGDSPEISLVSRLNLNGWSVSAEEARTAAFWDAVRKILGEQNPDARTRKLQLDIRSWLNQPLLARQNRRR